MEASLRCSKPRPCKQQANALQVDGPVATVRNAGPVTVTPVGLHAIRWMGLWPSSAMVVALELLERKRHWSSLRLHARGSPGPPFPAPRLGDQVCRAGRTPLVRCGNEGVRHPHARVHEEHVWVDVLPPVEVGAPGEPQAIRRDARLLGPLSHGALEDTLGLLQRQCCGAFRCWWRWREACGRRQR